jgi:Uncharacterized protein conserved in bacteria
VNIQNENEAYVDLLCVHLQAIVRRLRGIPPEKWDWQPDITAPSARILAHHAWQWLICDRQHILNADASQHPRIPEPPADPEAICQALVEETENWRAMLLSLTPEQFDEPRIQFNFPEPEMNVRYFVCHMIQNTIYKHGQLSVLYFMLGLDGPEPYAAPFPNPIYEEEFGPALS